MDRRKGISKTIRFEVFKRDAFRCQYCGQTPPTVILELDHIVPIAGGGGNEEINLVTSCRECNSGKGARSLDAIPKSLSDQMEERRERAEQIAAYNEFLLKIREVETQDIEELGMYWFNKFKEKQNHFVFGEARIPSVRTFLRYLTKAEILDAMDIAHGKISVSEWWRRSQSPEKVENETWKYFCGICWRKIKRFQGQE